MFLHFLRNSVAAKNGVKMLTFKKGLMTLYLPFQSKYLAKIASISAVFYAEIQAGCQKWCENDFSKIR